MHNPWIALLGGTTNFGSLAPGALFHFPKFPEALYVKGKGGWFTYENGDPGKFRTGTGTAVVKVTAIVKVTS